MREIPKFIWRTSRHEFCRMVGDRHVQVYYNRHENLLSVKFGDRVYGHFDEIKLVDVRFRVSSAGRSRALANKQRNVHAMAIGKPVIWLLYKPEKTCTYKPFERDTFITRRQLLPVHAAKYCHIQGTEIYVRATN